MQATDAKPKHSPLPWRVEESSNSIVSDSGTYRDTPAGGIALVFSMYDCRGNWHNPNIEFILRAVNSHDELVAALRNLLHEADDDGITQAGVDAALAALAKAEGGTN